MTRVVGGQIGAALRRYDEWHANLTETEEAYDQACEAGNDDRSSELADDVDELTRECMIAADVVIDLCRQVGILPTEGD